MKFQTTLLLATLALAPAFSSAVAGPPAPAVNPSTVTRLPATPLDPQARSVLVPAPATGPCLAELSMDRVEITRRSDGSAYDITVTVRNSGSEAATGDATASGGVLGIRIDITSIYRPRTEVIFTKQVANISVIRAGTSQSYGFSLSNRELTGEAREITAWIDRGPDGPRCAYDARRNNDGLGVSGMAMREWFAAGNSSFVRAVPGAR
jgi:hypothetical protein